jgi:hypothetical protein
VKVHGRLLNRFLRQTGALGVCGYRHSVDWVASAAFDVLLLDHLTDARNSRSSLKAANKRLLEEAGGLARRFQYRLQVLPS